ncbi:hypothetical protein AERO8C_70657 [Aeromonas veronii]|uniref:Uncharacterized protein n=1 Tax=Aeromonas veronii TaxID=654 RepID=A0A653LDY1_AERVE|nr:hypothetical protein AERO8C_70657 [Aeromonas veronii]
MFVMDVFWWFILFVSGFVGVHTCQMKKDISTQ